jgi:hypothetical protein
MNFDPHIIDMDGHVRSIYVRPGVHLADALRRYYWQHHVALTAPYIDLSRLAYTIADLVTTSAFPRWTQHWK